MSEVSINPNLSVNTDDLRAKINACFAAKRVVNREVEGHLDGIVDLLDDLLVKANNAEKWVLLIKRTKI